MALVAEQISEWVDIPCDATQVRLKRGIGPLRRGFHSRPGEDVAGPAAILTNRWHLTGNHEIERSV